MAFRTGRGGKAADRNDAPPLRFYSDGCSLLRTVRDVEDRTEIAAKAKAVEKHSLAVQRPAYGTLGKRASLWANYVALAPGKGHHFYRYSIQITRIKDNKDGKKQENTKVQVEQSSNNGAAELATQVAEQLTLNPNSNDPPNEPDDQPGNGDATVQPAGMKRAAIIAHLLSTKGNLGDLCKMGTIASDYRDNLVSTAPLEDLVYIVEYTGVRSNHKLERYKVALMEPNDIQNPLKLDDLLDYLDSDNLSSAPPIPEAVFAQVLNIWLRQFSKLKESSEPPVQKVVGSKAYPLTQGTNLPKDHPNVSFTHPLKLGVSSIRGYFSSIRFGAGKAWVNINVTHGAFFNNIPLGEWIRAAGYTKPSDYKQLHIVLKGLRVFLLHRGVPNVEGNKILVKVISGLATTSDGVPQNDKQKSLPADPNPPQFLEGSPRYGVQCAQLQFFDQLEKKYVSVYDHFKQKHPKYLPKKDELVVNLGSAFRPAYYPVSVCQILRGQNYHPKLTDTQTQEMIKFAVLRPEISVDCITIDGFKRIGLKNSQPHARLLNPAAGLATAQGRILARPEVKYGEVMVHLKPGKWNLAQVGRYSRQGQKAVWGILPIGEFSWYNYQYPEMYKELRRLMGKRGFDFAGNQNLDDCCLLPPPLTPKTTTETRGKELADHFEWLKGKGYNLLFVLLPNKGAELYHTIKTATDITVGIHTVCMVESKVGKKLENDKRLFDSQFFDNILLKANLKQGGVNHELDFPTSTVLSKLGAMVLGLDVTHSPPAAKKADTPPSIIGMVANADKRLAQWPATIAFQQRENQEIVTSVQSFETLLGPHLDRHYRLNKKYPAALILYRDGVSEGQYSQVASKEYEGIRAICATKYGSKNQDPPMISIIIVGKRHHTRFYPSAKDHADSKGNTLPGTVVDRSITSQFLWEFYLQAHEAIQGTARPAHYVVVADEFFRSTFGKAENRPIPKDGPPYENAADVLEAFTHALSYALGRSTRSIGVCTPARLADKVCDRARCYTAAGLTQEQIRIADNLKDLMFYI